MHCGPLENSVLKHVPVLVFPSLFFFILLGKHTVSEVQCEVFAPALCMYDSRKRLLGTFKNLQIIKTKKTPNQCNSLRICKTRAEHQSEVKIASL